MNLVLPLLQAIGRQEGVYAPILPGHRPNRPQRNNNPGDLEWHGWEAAFKGTLSPHDDRFAYFPTLEDGYDAARHLLTFPLYMGKTLTEVFNQWAPPGENDTNVYLLNVCAYTELPPATIITPELLAVPLLRNFTLGGITRAI